MQQPANNQNNNQNNAKIWATVSWMPHASLSQTSHVAISVRAALAIMDTQEVYNSRRNPQDDSWQVHVGVKGLAGLDLLPVTSATRSAPLVPLYQEDKDDVSVCKYPSVAGATHVCRWDKEGQPTVIPIPLRWRDLPRDAYLEFTLTGSRGDEALFAPSVVSFFDDYGKLRSGMNKIPLYRSLPKQDATVNLGLGSSHETNENDPVWKASKILEQLDRFEESSASNTAAVNQASPKRGNLSTKPSRESSPFRERTSLRKGANQFGEIPSVPWLDAMAREYCEQTIREAKAESEHAVVLQDPDDETEPSAYLVVEIPHFDVPVLHEDTVYPTPQQGPSGSVTPLDLALYHKELPTEKDSFSMEPLPFHPLAAIPFLDYENEHDSPVDDKYRTLAHDLLRGLVDPALKPDRIQRSKLAAIIASPSHHLTREEKDLLWRFRFSLVDNRKALTKFLLAVDWTVETEVVQAAELLEQWRKRSPIEVTDALKLLGKQVAYQTNLVRAYAIDTLAMAPDEELNLYLLQLVQALKFENSLQQQQDVINDSDTPEASQTTPKTKSSLATFLISRATKNVLLANYLYWYLKVELQDPAHGARYREIFDEFELHLKQTPYPSSLTKDGQGTSFATNHPTSSSSLKSQKSTSSLVNKLGESVSKLGDKLLGTTDPSDHPNKADAPSRNSKRNVRTVWDVLVDQDEFISGVMDVQMSYLQKAKQPAKEAHLRSVLEAEGYAPTEGSRSPFPMPCAPQIMVNGVFPEKAKVFKSAVYPALIEFNVEYVVDKTAFGKHESHSRSKDNPPKPIKNVPQLASYRVLMKTGDDLRQDQLVMMMIKLMDRLLKRASLDLCITPYSIIATSPSSGIVEFVEESCPLSAILGNHNNSILQFFRSVAPQPGTKYGVRPEVISSYVRSVAGGCVLTYLMGVGDRHLDNLMITKTGRFFHIDFGFMFGRDPKPLPPAFRLTREMVEGMGGIESAEYRQFCSLACQAFNALRKSAGLVLNLLHLMSDAGIEDLSNNPSADADGVIAKVEERFRLDLTDEQAERFFLTLIHESLNALAPRLMDVFHSIAVARR